MVERFQQQELASAQTPVNEVDHSMSRGAALIAQAADRQRDMVMSTAAQHIANAQSSYGRAGAFAQQAAGSVVNMLSAGMRANKGAGDEERRRLNVALARISENDLAEQTFNDYRQRFAQDPGAALAAFTADVPNMRQSFQERYGDDEKSLRELLPVHDGLERQTKARLESWATHAQNAQLESRLNLLPEEMSVQIDGLQGTVDEQLVGFQSLLASSNNTFATMFQSAQDEGTRNNITLQEIKAKRKLSQDFVNHLVAQTPQGEAGIGYIDQVGTMVQNAHKIGLPLSSDDQKAAVGTLETARRNQEQDAITSVQIEGDTRLLDVNSVKFDMYKASAAGDKKGLHSIAVQVFQKNQDLEQRIERISAEPDSNLKKAKILSLRKEQNAYISEVGMELSQQRTLVNFEMALAAQARAIENQMRNDIKWQNYQVDRDYRNEQRELSKQEKELKLQAESARAKQIDGFNQKWGAIQADLRQVYSLPPGEQQTARIGNIVKNAQPVLNEAVKAGTITVDSMRSYNNQLKSEMETAATIHTSKPANLFGVPLPWGGGQIKQRTGADKLKAQQKAQQDFANLVGAKRGELDSLGTAFSYLNRAGVNKQERAIMTQYMNEKLPGMVKSPAFQKLSAEQKKKELSKVVGAVIRQHRTGNLKR